MVDAERKPAGGDLSVTALYTAAVWVWGELPNAELLSSPDARRVFGATNAALAVARLFKPQVGSLRHSLLHRHLMIDHLLRASGAPQVLELAAGLSRRGVTFSAERQIHYTEVDLPPMIEHKRALLERTPEGRAALARDNLRLVGADVMDAPLEDLVSAGELFVIAEGLCVYLDTASQRALWGKVQALLARSSGTFVFDLLPSCEEPEPGAVGRALDWTMKRFTGGRGFARDERTRADIAADLENAGFSSVEVIDSATVARAWGLPFADVASRQVLFIARCGERV